MNRENVDRYKYVVEQTDGKFAIFNNELDAMEVINEVREELEGGQTVSLIKVSIH